MSKTKYILVFTIFCLTTSFTQNEVQWKSIENDSYKIQYPNDWQLDTSGRNKTEFVVFSKREKKDPFRENVNLIVQDLSNHIMNLESFVKLSENLIKKVPNSKILINERVKKGNVTYHQIIWKGYVNKQLLQFKQLYFIENNKAYTLTFTSQEKTYENYLTIVETILSSFIIK